MNKKYFQSYLPGIAWFFIMCVLLFMPGSDVPKPDNWMKKIFFDKWVHAGIFGLLSLLLMYPQMDATKPVGYIKKRLLLTAIVVMLWGITTEYIQKYFCVSRGFDLWDWAADCLGILIAYLLMRFTLQKNRQLTGKTDNISI